MESLDGVSTMTHASPTFALPVHFRRWGQRILFAFNVGSAETRQVKTLPLF